jgi:transposase
MPGKAAKIRLSEKQMEILGRISRETTATVRLVQRCQIILHAYAGRLNQDIAHEVKLHRRQVGLWRRRWQESFDALIAIECGETTAALRKGIEEVLSDAPRRGCPGTFTAEQVTATIAVACEPPENSGRPITHWTGREIADEVSKRGIVTSISPRQVNRFLATASLQPHKSRYWLNTKEKDHDLFQAQVETVCQTYLEAPELYFQCNTHTVCTDEMTGVQALERIA